MFIIIEVLNCFLSIPFSLLRYTYLGFTTLCLSLDLCIATWTVLVCTWAPGNALRGPDGMTSFHETLSLLKEEQMSIYYAFVASSNLLQWLSMAFIFKTFFNPLSSLSRFGFQPFLPGYIESVHAADKTWSLQVSIIAYFGSSCCLLWVYPSGLITNLIGTSVLLLALVVLLRFLFSLEHQAGTIFSRLEFGGVAWCLMAFATL